MEQAPTMITSKDLDYISDMFEWNYIAYKKINSFINDITDTDIKDKLTNSSLLFKNNLDELLNILGGSNE